MVRIKVDGFFPSSASTQQPLPQLLTIHIQDLTRTILTPSTIMSDKPSSGGGGRRFPSSKWEEDFESYFIENDPVKAEAMNAHDRELASPETATPKNKSKGKGKQVTPASPATA